MTKPKYRTPKGFSASDLRERRAYRDFSDEEKRKVRLFHTDHGMSMGQLVKRFDASPKTISRIVRESVR